VKLDPERARTAVAYCTILGTLVSLPLLFGDHIRENIDGYRSARREHLVTMGECQAIMILKVYAKAQKAFASDDLDEDGFFFYAADLGKLAEHAPGIIPENCDGPKALEAGWRGYRYVVRRKPLPGELAGLARDGLAPEMPELVAVPTDYGRTGKHTFFVRADGGLFRADTGGKLPEAQPAAPLFTDDGSTWGPVCE